MENESSFVEVGKEAVICWDTFDGLIWERKNRRKKKEHLNLRTLKFYRRDL